MKPIKNILVTTDFSADSELAVEEAAILAKKFNSTLYMLDVVGGNPAISGDYIFPFDLATDDVEKRYMAALNRMSEKVNEIESRFQIKAVADVRYGDVYDEIMKEEDEKEIDLVVIAPHMRKGKGRSFFSHLSEKIARDSQCATLIIKHSGEVAEQGRFFI